MEGKKKHSVLRWIGILFLLLILAAGAAALYYVRIAGKALDEITDQDESQTVFSVYVRTEDSAEKIKDTKEYTFGISGNAADNITYAQAAERLEDLLKAKPRAREYENPFELIEALKKEKVQAVVFNEAYLSSLTEVEEYEWAKEGIRRIASFAWKQEKGPEAAETSELPEKFVVYISGIDTYGDVSARSRSDVNILAVVNRETKKILMLATPRDFYVDFAATGGSKDKLTHAGIYGVEQSMDALERLYDIEIDYYVRMNFTGFVDLIDALGGVDVYSEYDFTVQNIRSYQKGWNHLSGIEALAFSRERYSFARGDYQRAANQMEVIRAVIQKAASPALLKNFRQTMDAVSGSFETNLPEKHLMELVKFQLLKKPKWQVETFTAQGTSSNEVTYSMPGQRLYVIFPDPASVAEAKQKIAEV